MAQRARGSFEVQLTPQPLSHHNSDPFLGRLSIDKRFTGDLIGSSTGEMLSAKTSVENSAGYVAIEQVTGTLHGRSGSFVLQHSSTMTRGVAHQTMTVVPDSGTDELTGLAGTMTIGIRHRRCQSRLTFDPDRQSFLTHPRCFFLTHFANRR
jgi:hypothetical protein